ncbi:citrate lyase ACP [Salmonella enterica subsp. enterica]|uniref:Citrate lyase ACP n=1 Tax=Salmonella enterica I TaxID=59201 RepID=A0A447MW67_SALET|nr:citrate lyase ACP [Salmonella enterica subsp. enterica]
MKINQLAVAGTLESGDVMIRIAPLDTQDIDLQINSSVEKQFGEAIRGHHPGGAFSLRRARRTTERR